MVSMVFTHESLASHLGGIVILPVTSYYIETRVTSHSAEV